MMKDTRSPMALWGEALSTAAYCVNRTATTANGGIMLIQAFEGTIPDISHMRTFYTDAYIHCPKLQGTKKLGDHAHLVKSIRYLEGVSGYKFYGPNTCTVLLSHSPHFLELPQANPVHDPADDNQVSVISDDDHTHDPDTSSSSSPLISPPLPPLLPPPPPPHVDAPTPTMPDAPAEPPIRVLCDRTQIHALA